MSPLKELTVTEEVTSEVAMVAVTAEEETLVAAVAAADVIATGSLSKYSRL